ncbi:MAG: 2-oxoacid:acceptor oxidoreductase subunit alpha [Pelolinea sp.]|nr:2-oxoacid:acceptor oxidoreductase subunit alpha [Pelolinea sp.]
MGSGQTKINDFGITFSTVNGSGSATANNTIQKTIFKMGIPVSARNIFPSNIQGMPTWYSMRVSKDGFSGRFEKDDILVAMNPETAIKDIKNLNAGGLLLINQSIKIQDIRNDITTYLMPVDGLLKASEVPSNLNVYLANMVYVGVLAFLIGIEIEKIEASLDQHFNGKKSAIEPNMKVVKKAFEWAESSLVKTGDYSLEPMQATGGKIMIDGNTAGALGALYGGLQFAAWYPITPATSLAEALNEFIPSLRVDPETNSITCAVVQAEDELAAIGMAVGAGWAGLRSMTSTSGPGLCLMSEFLGLAYFTEIPLVVWDVQRVGPSTGMPTHTSQSDLSFSYFISHGDKDFVILLPGNMNECFEFGWKGLDIAEKLQTPVIILSDLELGMNIWMADPLRYPDEEIHRGKVLWEEDIEKIEKEKQIEWGRYVDLDGDGIAYRTIPGNLHPKAPYFTRGTSHDPYAGYSESPEDWEKNLVRIKKKFELARTIVPKPVITCENEELAIISYGSSDMPVIEAIDKLKDQSFEFDYLRVRSIPFSDEVGKFIEIHKRIYVVENNRDGQMTQLLCVNYPDQAYKFISVAHSDGLSLSAQWIVNRILGKEKSEK